MSKVLGNLWVYFYIAGDFTSFWIVYKIVCVLSHEQSSVERGFSVNKELLVENLSKVYITSQHQVYDYFQSFGMNNYAILSDLIKSGKGAHDRYQAALEDYKTFKAKPEKDGKKKKNHG